MADNETDALLKDLESRAGASAPSAGAGGADDGGDEDIEAFLRSLEGDDYVPPEEPQQKKTKTKSADELDTKFEALEEAPEAPLEKAKPKKEKKKKQKKQKKATEQADEGTEVAVAESKKDGLKKVARVLKWTIVLLPMLAAWWVLGAYLSNWVSAGWLVFILATLIVFGLPLGLMRAVKRGRYIWWMAGSSALVAAGLVAPLPTPSANALASYGHWPTSALAEVAGLKRDSPLIQANAAIGGWVGSWVDPQKSDDPNKRFPRQLGTDDALNPDDAVDPNAQPPDPNAQPPDPNAQPQPDPNAQPPDPNAQPPDPNAQPQPDPNAQPQPDPNAQPQPNPNAQPPDPNAQPQPDPNAQPPDPNAQPQPDPNAQPQPNPNAQPKPQPNAQPKPQPDPNAQPKPQPDPNAQPKPQPDPNAQPEGVDSTP